MSMPKPPFPILTLDNKGGFQGNIFLLIATVASIFAAIAGVNGFVWRTGAGEKLDSIQKTLEKSIKDHSDILEKHSEKLKHSEEVLSRNKLVYIATNDAISTLVWK